MYTKTPDTQNVNSNSSGYTLLHFGVSSDRDQPEIVQMLLNKDTKKEMVNLFDPNGDTALQTAVFNGHIKEVKLLINAGAEVNTINKLGQSPLSAALARNHFKIALLLIKNGARLNGINGKNHWLNELLPKLATEIDQNGNLLSNEYDLQPIFEAMKNFYLMQLREIVEDEKNPCKVGKDIIEKYITSCLIDNKVFNEHVQKKAPDDYREYFVKKMLELLNKTKFADGSLESKYIILLKTAVTSGGAKDAYNRVHPVVTQLNETINSINSSSFKENMKPIKSNIIKLMVDHNNGFKQEHDDDIVIVLNRMK